MNPILGSISFGMSIIIASMLIIVKEKLKFHHLQNKYEEKCMQYDGLVRAIDVAKRHAAEYGSDEDIIEMARYAMTQAHPDNPGGNNEKFIKYQNIYNALKRRE